MFRRLFIHRVFGAAASGEHNMLGARGKPPAWPYNRHARCPTLYFVEANGEDGRGTSQKAGRTPSAGSGWTTTKVAGKALDVSPRTVQSYIRRGLLDGKTEGEGVKRAWLVSVDSINALRAERLAEDGGEGFRDGSAEALAESIGEAVQNISTRLAEESAKAARLEERLAITERAQSTVEEEARALREENERLRCELKGLREKPEERSWWRQFFGF
jgi:DNA-binding transcriptional MerR regulator